MAFENAILIRNKTRLESLIERFNTKAQAKFYIEHAGGDFKDYEREHDTFYRSFEKIQNSIYNQLKYKVVERKFLPNFLFSDKDIALVVGQDGLVANTAKYVHGQPILAINPDLERFDGVLLPYTPENFMQALQRVLNNKANYSAVTMAEALLNDGQRLLAFNDLFIGHSSHVSARYKISHQGMVEHQSSSGIIVSTGAGSTGWLSSTANMLNGIRSVFGNSSDEIRIGMEWDSNQLIFIVREPFKSKYSDTSIAAGSITEQFKLRIESLMPSNGIIFSDGIESDFLNFNSGAIVEISTSKQKAYLVK